MSRPAGLLTRRKRVCLLALLLLFLSLPVAALIWLRFETDDTPLLRNFNQVRQGMTRAEVENILGPPSWEPPPTDDLVLVTDKGKKLVMSFRWQQDGQVAVLHFDEGGVVGMKEFISNSRRQEARQWWVRTFGIQPPFDRPRSAIHHRSSFAPSPNEPARRYTPLIIDTCAAAGLFPATVLESPISAGDFGPVDSDSERRFGLLTAVRNESPTTGSRVETDLSPRNPRWLAG
jgi:hypothetical protein